MLEQDQNNLNQEEEELFERYRVQADEKQSLIRIDKFLLDRLGNVSRNRLQNAIKAGLVKVNEEKTKSNYKIKPKDEVVVFLPKPDEDRELIAQEIPLNIVHEDESLIVVNKPAGMVVHPAIGNWDGTLVNGLLYHFQHLPSKGKGDIRPGLVHRIDKNTSGLLVIAKSEEAHTQLAAQFFDHSVDRTYQALVWGDPGEEGIINAPIDRSSRDRKLRAVVEEGKGKEAITHYKRLTSFGPVSLIECKLETGRTHQIRVHLQHLGHPLFGDPEYGGQRILKGPKFSKYKVFVEALLKSFQRQALHAKTLGFKHPENEKEVFYDSELAGDMASLLEEWEKYEAEGL